MRTQFAPGYDQLGTVQAVSAETGATEWLYEQRTATMSLVATGGGLVFGGDVNGRFRAFDDETGEVLWEINLGSAVTAFPITYAVGGRQYVAVSTGTAGTASGFIRLTPEITPSAANWGRPAIGSATRTTPDAARRSGGRAPGLTVPAAAPCGSRRRAR